ncbi:GLPGLI family protein [uncultured Chryseobacterium sp.]|uniref:GLPGLI family protein n=1 Tax=uncultured Chryseobacterium sp. TaxID=259322 RepID=UPI0025FD34CC|nr:GLPGLI family protein [uncultured Chryseobacterium sp.]
MKIFAFFLFLISGTVSSQNQRFVYEYVFKMDSLNRDHADKEIMNLDVTRDGSYFYSALLITRDSLFTTEMQKSKASNTLHIDFRKIRQPKIGFRVSKTYSGPETVFHTSLNAVNVAVREENRIRWTIHPETKSIAGFKAQKATSQFRGRNWTAWFTNDIQIPDGPYTFCGLPGLILQIADEREDHVFSFAGSRKLPEGFSLIDSQTKEIFVTREKFNRLWNEYILDPAKNIKIIHGSAAMSETLMFDSNTGEPLDKQTLIRNKELGVKKLLKRFNNFIEKDLYKQD